MTENTMCSVNFLTATFKRTLVNLPRFLSSPPVCWLPGGVGIAAAQLCHTVPDVTVFGTASASTHDVIPPGDDVVFDYRIKDCVGEIRKISPDGEKTSLFFLFFFFLFFQSS